MMYSGWLSDKRRSQQNQKKLFLSDLFKVWMLKKTEGIIGKRGCLWKMERIKKTALVITGNKDICKDTDKEYLNIFYVTVNDQKSGILKYSNYLKTVNGRRLYFEITV